ncbi:MAG TPA: glycerol-3-phosphate 1-O-acyltransferase PlsY [Gemmatimonadaceae bacterium]|nr:glycerol-3-phosphate 1-O-acyltransferase PlsY [Gemmatimonadaceae bacterium]
MSPWFGLLIAYLCGGIPAAYLAGRWLRGIDLREHGSGNLGATNVFRVLGWKAGLAVLLFDTAKGAVPVWLLPRWIASPAAAHWALVFGVAAILGHVRSPYLGWKSGGKGVATAGGVFLALATRPTLISLIAFAATVYLSGYVSLASLVAAVVLPLSIALLMGLRAPALVLSVLVALFVFWTHRANIGRLLRGEEHRFRRGSPPD